MSWRDRLWKYGLVAVVGFGAGAGVAVAAPSPSRLPGVGSEAPPTTTLAAGPPTTLVSLVSTTSPGPISSAAGAATFVGPTGPTVAMAAPATGSPTTGPPATTLPATTLPATTLPEGPVVYVVQPGDNLSVIAWWFELHGFEALYEANRAVIGENPNLIFPGQTIIVDAGKLRMGQAGSG